MDSLGKVFTGDRGLENSLLLAGILAPRVTIGPNAQQRLREGGGTGLQNSLLAISQLLGSERKEEEGKKSFLDFAQAVQSGKPPTDLSGLPSEFRPAALQFLASQAERTQEQERLKKFKAERAERNRPPIPLSSLLPESPSAGVLGDQVSPSPDLRTLAERFTRSASPKEDPLDELVRLFEVDPTGKLGTAQAALFRTEEMERQHDKLNDLREKEQALKERLGEAKNETERLRIEKRHEEVVKKIDDLNARLEKTLASREKIAGMQEAGKTLRTVGKGKNTQSTFDKDVETFIGQFRALRDIPAGTGFFGARGQTAEAQAMAKISAELNPTRKSQMERAFLLTFHPESLAPPVLVPPRQPEVPANKVFRFDSKGNPL